MLHMLEKDGYVAMKREAEDRRSGDRVKESDVNTCCIAQY